MQFAQQAGVYLDVGGYEREYTHRSELILPEAELRNNQMHALMLTRVWSAVCPMSEHEHVHTYTLPHSHTKKPNTSR